MTEAFFFEDNGRKLFGALDFQNNIYNKKSLGIVFCAPFAEEKLRTQRVYTNFARYLSARGFNVLRFDYFGHGDSDGNFEEADIHSRLQNIKRAINLLREKTDAEIVGLFGLRFGATLAAVIANQEPGIDFLLLWEPIIQGKKYIKDCLRTNLAYQIAMHKKIKYTRDQMIKDLTEDIDVNIDGYLLTGKLFRQINEIDLSKNDVNFVNLVQIVHLTKNFKKKSPDNLIQFYKAFKHQNNLAEFQKIQIELFWGPLKNYYQRKDELFDLSAKWLKRISVPNESEMESSEG